jgi:uncharacterized protein (TIGR04255 family)
VTDPVIFSTQSPLPEYEHPPVVEVVCGCLFDPVNLQIPHFGLLWERFRKEYPGCQEVAPLVPSIETFDDQEHGPLEFPKLPLPRIWFLNTEGTGIIQVQRDRFLHNWKKASGSEAYPRYAVVKSLFSSHYTTFQRFVRDSGFDKVEPRQYEMTYVNHIMRGDGWGSLADVRKIFPDLSWRDDRSRFLQGPEVLASRWSFQLPAKAGRLHATVQPAIHKDTMASLLQFELTVRGFPGESSDEAMWQWFDSAREWIVRGFSDLTAEGIQKEVWKRVR